ncbi:protein of unknown function [Methylocaldum szegediense]|uniref:Uncharacterized protein n=1 Tax=Methylocaldum szegediense TaxID=73780 RepID=A0ABN8X0Y5_9GAMM|nr:protein of unknown function [Methylocaldum szegediense]
MRGTPAKDKLCRNPYRHYAVRTTPDIDNCLLSDASALAAKGFVEPRLSVAALAFLRAVLDSPLGLTIVERRMTKGRAIVHTTQIERQCSPGYLDCRGNAKPTFAPGHFRPRLS